jgi:adenosylhomocysteine nucleosidase
LEVQIKFFLSRSSSVFIRVHPWLHFFGMSEQPVILACFAVKEEAAPFKAAVGSRPDIQILLTGMGKRNAEKAIRTTVAAQKPSLVVTCGFTGALNPDLTLGAVLFGCEDAPQLQPRLLAAGARPGRFHCANRVASTAAEKLALWETTHADAVEMESQIITEICRAHQIPCATIRVILDAASEDLPLDFNFLMTADQQMDYRKLAFSLAKSPSKIGALLRLQKQSKEAASKLAEVLLKIVSTTNKHQ